MTPVMSSAIERALEYMDSPGHRASRCRRHVFIGSCTNGRIEDLRVAGTFCEAATRRHAPDGCAGSARRLQAESEGLDQVFLEAGSEWRGAGCSMCLE